MGSKRLWLKIAMSLPIVWVRALFTTTPFHYAAVAGAFVAQLINGQPGVGWPGFRIGLVVGLSAWGVGALFATICAVRLMLRDILARERMLALVQQVLKQVQSTTFEPTQAPPPKSKVSN